MLNSFEQNKHRIKRSYEHGNPVVKEYNEKGNLIMLKKYGYTNINDTQHDNTPTNCIITILYNDDGTEKEKIVVPLP